MGGKKDNTVVLILLLIVIGLFFYLGYITYPKLHPSEEITTDTVYVYDTVTYHIPNNIHHYHSIIDTLIIVDTVINNVDTAAILKDYFAYYIARRSWQDSSIIVNLIDTITQNRFRESILDYKLLRPQQVINKVVNNYNYQSYVYVGVTVPFKDAKYSDFGLFYAFPRGYAGLGYNPALKSLSFRTGYRIFKFDKD